VWLSYATIRAPFDGVITERNFFVGDFISEADGKPQLPLLSLQAVKRLRAVVQVPDRDVPYANPGDPALIEIDALPGRQFEAKISRIARFESPQSRTMRAEIDLDNQNDELRVGMYGRATLNLQDGPQVLLLPSRCLVDRNKKGKAAVYVVREGKARKVAVNVGADNGIDTEIVSGVSAAEQVVLRPSSVSHDGESVVVRE
jgi:RND family efflux transporter MFP subunit